MNLIKIKLLTLVTIMTFSNFMASVSNIGVIFLGDSRTVGMFNCVELPENCYTVAEIGKGYDWLVSDGLEQIQAIKEQNTNITNWYIVSNLGVNDLGNIQKYKKAYADLTKENNVVLVSVNEIDESKFVKLSNIDIEKFNAELQTIKNTYYIDTYEFLKNKGFTASDGLHYNRKTYETLYDFITTELKNTIIDKAFSHY